VVGSVAYDGVETPHGRIERMLARACTYIAVSASYFNPVKIVAVVGEDFDEADVEFLKAGTSIWRGWSGFRARRFSGRRVFAGHERPHHDPDRSERLRRFPAEAAGSLQGRPIPAVGNIQPALQKSVREQMNGVRLVGGDT